MKSISASVIQIKVLKNKKKHGKRVNKNTLKTLTILKKLLKECEKDLLDEDDDDEVYSNSESEE